MTDDDKFTIDQFDAAVSAVGDCYIGEVKRISSEFELRLEACADKAVGLPAHMIKASLDNVLKRVQELSLDKDTSHD